MEAVGNGSPCRRGVREERKRAKIKPRLRYWGSEREGRGNVNIRENRNKAGNFIAAGT